VEFDAGAITTLVSISIGAIGATGGFFIRRADKRREKREAVMEELYRQRIKDLEAEVAASRAAEDAALEKLRHVERTALRWRGQLKAAQIEPDPEDLPEV